MSMNQFIINGQNSYRKIETILKELEAKKFLLVCDEAFPFLPIKDYFDEIGVPFVKFNDFTPNPLYESVCKGVKLFNDQDCDCIIAVGGGSTIDVSKCIKLFSRMNPNVNYLKQEYAENDITLITIPTTAGTGSESTRYAVIYYNGEKQSVTHESIIPRYAILEHSVLTTLPVYQKKCTMLDALCQGIESWWSVKSTDESKLYSQKAVELIMQNMDLYIYSNTDEAAIAIMLAANYSGRAINITQTTAAHAMSYKITSIYGLPHGHAVAICLPKVWKYMLDHMDEYVEARGLIYLKKIFEDISKALNVLTITDAINGLENILKKLEITTLDIKDKACLDILIQSVNVDRLKNNPVKLDSLALEKIYREVFNIVV